MIVAVLRVVSFDDTVICLIVRLMRWSQSKSQPRGRWSAGCGSGSLATDFRDVVNSLTGRSREMSRGVLVNLLPNLTTCALARQLSPRPARKPSSLKQT